MQGSVSGGSDAEPLARVLVTLQSDRNVFTHTDMAGRYELQLGSPPGDTALRFYQTLVPASRTPDEPMRVFLFAKREEFKDFTERTFPARAEVLTKVRGGGFMENGITVIQYVAHATTFPVMTHEGFHQYLHQYATPGVPAWLNEGLAVLCDGWCRLDPARNAGRLAKPAEAQRRS